MNNTTVLVKWQCIHRNVFQKNGQNQNSGKERDRDAMLHNSCASVREFRKLAYRITKNHERKT